MPVPDLFEADFQMLKRQPPYKRPRLLEPTTADASRDQAHLVCSCEGSLPEPDSTTVQSSKFAKEKKRNFLLSTAPSKRKQNVEANQLSTTIVRVADHQSKHPKPSNNFSLSLHMKHFEPWEISVKLQPDERTLVVRGKHEVVADENSHHEGDDYECLEYVKHLKVPANVAIHRMKCQLDQNGWLQIEAPMRTTTTSRTGERTIPVRVISRSPPAIEEDEEIVID